MFLFFFQIDARQFFHPVEKVEIFKMIQIVFTLAINQLNSRIVHQL